MIEIVCAKHGPYPAVAEQCPDCRAESLPSLQPAYDAWPQEARDKFWYHLHQILQWRERDRLSGSQADAEAIAALFWEHSHLDIGVYT